MIFLWGWGLSGGLVGSDGFPSAPPSQVSGRLTTCRRPTRRDEDEEERRRRKKLLTPVPRCDITSQRPLSRDQTCDVSHKSNEMKSETWKCFPGDAAFMSPRSDFTHQTESNLWRDDVRDSVWTNHNQILRTVCSLSYHGNHEEDLKKLNRRRFLTFIYFVYDIQK